MPGEQDALTFPTTVYDDAGAYLVTGGGRYRVVAPALNRLASLTSAARDAQSAYEFMADCTEQATEDGLPDIEQALWIAAVVRYGRIFKRNNARKAFKAEEFIAAKLNALEKQQHSHMLMLRDKMFAHDDGVGEDKSLCLSLPPKPPKHWLEVGAPVSEWRVISLGTDIATKLLPLLGKVQQALEKEREAERDRVLHQLWTTRFEGVTLLGLHTKEEPDLWPAPLDG